MDPSEAEFIEDSVPWEDAKSSKKKKKDGVEHRKVAIMFPLALMNSLKHALAKHDRLYAVELQKKDAEFGTAMVKQILVPQFFALVSEVEAEWKQRKAERKYVFNMEKQKEKYLRDTKTVERIDYDTVPAPQLHPQVKPSMVKITALHQLGNYSFKVKEKVVHVPGHPSYLIKPNLPHVAKPTQYKEASLEWSDPHAATFDYPFDATLVAMHELKKDFNIDDYDLVTSRNNLGKLFSWIIGSEDTWRIDAEVMNNANKTVFFRRRDLPKMQSDNEAAALEFEQISGVGEPEGSSFHTLLHLEIASGVPNQKNIKILMLCEVDAVQGEPPAEPLPEPVEVPAVHPNAEAKVMRTTEAPQRRMVEMKTIFRANWISDNYPRLISHWFQCWIARVDKLVVGVKESDLEGRITITELHEFQPGPMPKPQNATTEFDPNDFFHTRAHWPGVEGFDAQTRRSKLTEARLKSLHKLYNAVFNVRAKLHRLSATGLKKVALVFQPEKKQLEIFKPSSQTEKWAIPPWFEQMYAEKAASAASVASSGVPSPPATSD